jgi:N-hydroxyarylamine O-acetyltransferase
LSVPFENLDIHTGRRISVDLESFFQKIVARRRGGFCYELNGLFAALLESLGYQVVLLSARVFSQSGDIGPEYDHLTVVVALEERWLADVGFGDSFREPLRLADAAPQAQHGWEYLVEHRQKDSILRRREYGGGWIDQYVFTMRPRDLAEFAGMCDYHQTSPESVFTRGRICSLATPAGRISLSEMRLIITERDLRSESELASESDYRRILLERFGIDLAGVPFLKEPSRR